MSSCTRLQRQPRLRPLGLVQAARQRFFLLRHKDGGGENDPVQRQEMIEKSGQMLSPCVEVNGTMLPDVSGEEVEAYLKANQLVSHNEAKPEAPIDQPCADEMHQPQPISFRQP